MSIVELWSQKDQRFVNKKHNVNNWRKDIWKVIPASSLKTQMKSDKKLQKTEQEFDGGEFADRMINVTGGLLTQLEILEEKSELAPKKKVTENKCS